MICGFMEEVAEKSLTAFIPLFNKTPKFVQLLLITFPAGKSIPLFVSLPTWIISGTRFLLLSSFSTWRVYWYTESFNTARGRPLQAEGVCWVPGSAQVSE